MDGRPLKNLPASPEMKAARDDVIKALRVHQDRLSAPEILAIVAHMVGQLIAFQDQNAVSKDDALAIVQENIVLGNTEALESLQNGTGSGFDA